MGVGRQQTGCHGCWRELKEAGEGLVGAWRAVVGGVASQHMVVSSLVVLLQIADGTQVWIVGHCQDIKPQITAPDC